jgi:Histidine phosphatase superfamily (branch 1)
MRDSKYLLIDTCSLVLRVRWNGILLLTLIVSFSGFPFRVSKKRISNRCSHFALLPLFIGVAVVWYQRNFVDFSLLVLSRSQTMASLMISIRSVTGLCRQPEAIRRALSSAASSHSNANVTRNGETRKAESISSKNFNSLNQDTPFQLCFLRHGQSTWNRENIFIGWTDTPLTPDGVLEARVAGQMLQNSGIRFDEVHTSLLRRSIRTANLALMELGQEYLPVYKHWRLNERNYGSLVGKNKKEVVKMHGKDQVKRWRRSYDEPPPPMEDDHPYHPALDPRYQQVSERA